MRTIARLSLFLFVVLLAAGPVSAAPLLTAHAPVVSAPGAASHAGPLAEALQLLVGASVVGITIKKDVGAIATKFATRAAAASGDYKTGVSNAGGAWEQATSAAEPNYDAGVQQAIAQKKFGRGVQGKGGKYQTNAVNLGASRYTTGVQNAQSAYQAGMAPVLQVLSAIQLPPKGVRGSQQNQARSNAVATALAAWRANK